MTHVLSLCIFIAFKGTSIFYFCLSDIICSSLGLKKTIFNNPEKYDSVCSLMVAEANVSFYLSVASRVDVRIL